MKFLIDAQLPIRLKKYLTRSGHDVVHTFELPQGSFTEDMAIIRVADQQSRIVITKDIDFVKQNLITGKPSRILFLTMGNLKNRPC